MENKPKMFSIEMIQEKSLDKKGKEIKDKNGDVFYKRNDLIGLMNLLGKFDSKLHDIKQYKLFLKLKDKIRDAWANDDTKIDASVDQVAFLKDYLTEFPNKEGKTHQIPEFEIRTLVGILEQLD